MFTCVTITYHEPKLNPPVFLGGRGAHILHGERGRRAGTFIEAMGSAWAMELVNVS